MAWDQEPDYMKAEMVHARDEGLRRKGHEPNSGCLGMVLGWIVLAWAVVG